MRASRPDRLQKPDGCHKRGVRRPVDRLRGAVRPDQHRRGAVPGLFAQTRRPGADTAQHLHLAVPRDEEKDRQTGPQAGGLRQPETLLPESASKRRQAQGRC
uniref:(northern house mosquito) hypothetical protein n=1 Tax=Culex pipiens TaxID=7175 RepID=A0A8D8C599_CULPI